MSSFYTLFEEARVAFGEACSKCSMKALGMYAVHFYEKDEYSDFQNSSIFLRSRLHKLVKCYDTVG